MKLGLVFRQSDIDWLNFPTKVWSISSHDIDHIQSGKGKAAHQLGQSPHQRVAKADAGHAAVLHLANARAATPFALSLERLVSRRGWRSVIAEDRHLGLAEPVVLFAERSLDRLDHKLRKRGWHFRSLSSEARHALRIAMKHMRYATEFFGHLFHPTRAAKRYAEKAAALQDLLGELNDATIALRLGP